MNQQPTLSNSVQQRLALLPKMLQSIEVLQLTSADLLSLIDRELETNETLVAEPLAADIPVDEVVASADSETDSWEALQSPGTSMPSYAEDTKQGFLNNVEGPRETLSEYLIRQVSWLDVSPEILAGVSSLVEHLDERGFLLESDEALQDLLGTVDMAPYLETLQSLEPRGIGARGPVEAMLLQLPATDPDFADIRAMLTLHIEALACNKFPEVARALGRSLQEVQDLVARIKTLDPCPGAGFSSPVDSECVFPDVTVRLVGGEIEIEIDDMVLPDLGIQPDYELMARDQHVDQQTRSYLSNKLKLARELIGAVEQRKRTLGRVAYAMMAYQRDFLMQGPLSVRPLCMSQVAEQVGLHPSTVSRAIAGKFVQTDHGIFCLRDFFDGDRRASSSQVEGTGRMAVKDHVRDLVNSEDSRCPLSDDDLVQRLIERDIRVARRTVAKYRKELGLPSSWRRRTFESGD